MLNVTKLVLGTPACAWREDYSTVLSPDPAVLREESWVAASLSAFRNVKEREQIEAVTVARKEKALSWIAAQPKVVKDLELEVALYGAAAGRWEAAVNARKSNMLGAKQSYSAMRVRSARARAMSVVTQGICLPFPPEALKGALLTQCKLAYRNSSEVFYNVPVVCLPGVLGAGGLVETVQRAMLGRRLAFQSIAVMLSQSGDTSPASYWRLVEKLGVLDTLYDPVLALREYLMRYLPYQLDAPALLGGPPHTTRLKVGAQLRVPSDPDHPASARCVAVFEALDAACERFAAWSGEVDPAQPSDLHIEAMERSRLALDVVRKKQVKALRAPVRPASSPVLAPATPPKPPVRKGAVKALSEAEQRVWWVQRAEAMRAAKAAKREVNRA